MITDRVPSITHRIPHLNIPRVHHPSVETTLALVEITPIRAPTVVSRARVPLRATRIELHIWMTTATSIIHNGQHLDPAVVLAKTAQEWDITTDPTPLPHDLHLPTIHNPQGQWIVVTINRLPGHSQEKRIIPSQDPKAMVHETCLRLRVTHRPQVQQRTVEKSALPSKPRTLPHLLLSRYLTSHSVCKSEIRHLVLLLCPRRLPLAIV